MKKTLLLLSISLFSISINAQEIIDAMRYSVDNLNGTARFRAMGGAFGALGGDLSSINVNPAGSAIFNNNQLGITLSNYYVKNNAEYFGSKSSESENNFDLNQAGGVFVFKNNHSNSNWTKIAVSINYENSNNFDNSQFISGVNPNNSVANYFLSYANGVPLDVLENVNYSQMSYQEQQAYFGYQGYIINPVSIGPNNTNYTSNVRSGGNYLQENEIYASGYNGKLSFNVATSYKDRLFIGLNLNSHFSNFGQSTRFYEANSNVLTNNYEVNRLRFSNDLYTNGTGFSFQLGTILKIKNNFRVGLAYESPTWMNLSDELSQRLSSVRSNISGELPADVIDPRITNYYAPYRLQTPSRYTGSLAYVFGKRGLLSMDYSIRDYNNVKFRPSNDDYYRELNSEMSAILGYSGELRIGAEYKIKALSLRGGYRFEQSPYKNKTTIGDLNGFSGGLGYNFGATKVDLAYSYTKRNNQQGLFTTGLTDASSIDVIQKNISLTVLFEL